MRRAATSFIGRETEVVEVEAALRAHRLVSLTGVGGVGKTRLALEVAARLVDEFPDGVWFFELAAVTDPAAVPDAVAAVLGITQQPGKTVTESVAAALEGRLRLLVFDNCEHILDAAADLIEAILARSATVRILATSREGLGIADEQLWPVPSLDVGAGIDSAAVNLFVERAHSVAPRFSMGAPDEAEAVIEICRRLDGIPLAIELAASRMASMTAREVRDRLDQRFRLPVGSRRGLQRHHTLRHAVAWSYDLLAEAEKTLLERCSVLAGGFDLQSACAVAGFDDTDDLAILDLLDALVRKSLLIADRSSGRTRFSMLETIRQFAEEQLVARGEATEVRDAHARYFAGRETDIMALWDGPRQRAAYDWFTIELANLRTAFRWATDRDDLDSAAAIAVYASFLGIWLQRWEPIGWAEELIAPARAVDHRRLAQLYMLAAICFVAGRTDDAVGYADAGWGAMASGRFDKVPFELDAWAGGAYVANGQPERWVELSRNVIAREPGSHTVARACLTFALNIAGAGDEASAVSEDLLAAADATDNPWLACAVLLAYGVSHREVAPITAYDVLRRGLRIAQESGNERAVSDFAASLSRVAATRGNPVDAFEYLALAIRNFYDAGSFTDLYSPLAILAVVFDRLGDYKRAATISGFALNPWTRSANRELATTITHLREVLGDETYESLARNGETMTTAAMVTYAYDQIDQARAELNTVAK